MFYSDLTKAQILDILMNKLSDEYNLRENAICGDDKDLCDKFYNRYEVVKEIVISCHIYGLVNPK